MYDNLRNLRVGQKYTLAGFSYIGIPYHVQFILKQIRCTGMENGQDAYHMIYRKLDTKAICNMSISSRKQFIIWEGLHTPDTQMVVKTFIKDFDSGAVKKLYCWPKNDSRYMQRAKLSIAQPSIVENFNPHFNTTEPQHWANEGSNYLSLVN